MSMPDITLNSPDRAIPLLEQDGYALIRDVLSAEDVERARVICDNHLLADPEAENEIEATALLRMPELTFMFDERIVEALTMWLGGTLAYYLNYIARLNRFTDWHVDNGFPEVSRRCESSLRPAVPASAVCGLPSRQCARSRRRSGRAAPVAQVGNR
jgi:hypothetical protein